jgi:hypothetical protein
MIIREDIEKHGFEYLGKISHHNLRLIFKIENIFEIGYIGSGYKCSRFYIEIFPDKPHVIIWAAGLDTCGDYRKEIDDSDGEKFFEGTINNKEELDIIIKAIIH